MNPFAPCRPGHAHSWRKAMFAAVMGGSSLFVYALSIAAAADANDDVAHAPGTPAASHAPAVRFRPPQVLHRAIPRYPRAAYATHSEGETEVLVTVAADSSLVAASVSKSSGNADLDSAALDAMRNYTFKSAEQNGVRVQAQAYLSIEWTITAAVEHQFAVTKRHDTREQDVLETHNWITAQSH